MNCPDCGGDMWDNRTNKRNPKGPDFKCKNKDCGKAIWEKKGSGANGTSGGNGAGPRSAVGGGNGRSASSRPLGPLYSECLDFAKRAVGHHLPNSTNADIIAAAATLFIAATRDGSSLMPVKAKPAPPPPPPPKPEPEPEQDYDVDLADLPF